MSWYARAPSGLGGTSAKRQLMETGERMSYHVPERLNDDPSEPAVVHSAEQSWTPSPQAGVERRFLERIGGEVARATSVVRYAPDSAFPTHRHDKGEEYLVLSGVFSDEHGDFPEGAYVRNPPGSSHAPFTKDGCIILVKLRQMPPSEGETILVRTDEAPALATAIDGLSRIPLYESDGETVSLDILAPGAHWTDRADGGGEEIFVVDGDLTYGDVECGVGTWLRYPPGAERPMRSRHGCRLYVKRGHLGQPPAADDI